MRVLSIIRKLADVREVGAVDDETHVMALNIAEVADILDERYALVEALRDAQQAMEDRDIFGDDPRITAAVSGIVSVIRRAELNRMSPFEPPVNAVKLED